MKSAKKVRVPINKKITPKRKKMRSKPRKQSKKRKHRGGGTKLEGEKCTIGQDDCDYSKNLYCTGWPNSKCKSRLTSEQVSAGIKPTLHNVLSRQGDIDYHNCPKDYGLKPSRFLNTPICQLGIDPKAQYFR
tara:strand:- start:370 stop:765 length:396 start_codon:yes stop_codon:yes gene_type:complete